MMTYLKTEARQQITVIKHEKNYNSKYILAFTLVYEPKRIVQMSSHQSDNNITPLLKIEAISDFLNYVYLFYDIQAFKVFFVIVT